MTEQTKRCTKCGRVLPLSEFHLDRTKRDGHFTRCKDCRAEYQRKYREEHREKLADYFRNRYAQEREMRRACARRYYARHREEIAETRRRKYVPRQVRAQAPASNPNAEMCARLDAAIRARQGADA